MMIPPRTSKLKDITAMIMRDMVVPRSGSTAGEDAEGSLIEVCNFRAALRLAYLDISAEKICGHR